VTKPAGRQYTFDAVWRLRTIFFYLCIPMIIHRQEKKPSPFLNFEKAGGAIVNVCELSFEDQQVS
jgi:hypothetical protein